MYGVLLWADMNAATPLGAWGRFVISLAVTGQPLKRSVGPWVLPVFAALARFKFLRGTALDPFGYQEERQTERRLVAEYEGLVEDLIEGLVPHGDDESSSSSSLSLAVDLASIPEQIRGFGHVKEEHIKTAKAQERVLLEQLHGSSFRIG